MATYPPTLVNLPEIFNPDEFYQEETGALGTLAQTLIEGNDAGANQIDMNNNKIVDCANPTSAQDVATKFYVDSQGVNTIQAGDNITITSSPTTDPIVSFRNPFNADVQLGTRFINGTTGYARFAAAAQSEAQMSALLGFISYDATDPNIITSLYKTGLTIQTATDDIAIDQNSITKTAGSTTLGIKSNTSSITLTPLTATDCDVVVSGAGKLHIQQSTAGGQANPLCRLSNSNATGSVAMEVYKNKPTAVANGDVLFNQSVYGNDSGLAKQEYTRITHTIRDGTSGGEDGSIEFGCFVNNAFSNFLQINGNENEVNCLKVLDMGGNNIRTNTGSLTLDGTTAPNGSGTINLNPRTTAVCNVNGNFRIPSTSNNLVVGDPTSGFSSLLSSQNAYFQDLAGARSGVYNYASATLTDTDKAELNAQSLIFDDNIPATSQTIFSKSGFANSDNSIQCNANNGFILNYGSAVNKTTLDLTKLEIYNTGLDNNDTIFLQNNGVANPIFQLLTNQPSTNNSSSFGAGTTGFGLTYVDHATSTTKSLSFGNAPSGSSYIIHTDNVSNAPLDIQTNQDLQMTIGSGKNLIMTNLPTSNSGLPAGALWNNGGVLNIA